MDSVQVICPTKIPRTVRNVAAKHCLLHGGKKIYKVSDEFLKSPQYTVLCMKLRKMEELEELCDTSECFECWHHERCVLDGNETFPMYFAAYFYRDEQLGVDIFDTNGSVNE